MCNSLRRLLLAVAAAVMPACGDGPTPPQQFTVGPEGGTIELAGGVVRLVFPAGAVAQTTTFSATATSGPAAPTVVSGTVFDIQPSVTFAVPVSITINYGTTALPAGVLEGELGIYKVVSNAWQKVGGSTVNPNAKTITASVTSFSVHGVLGAPVASVTATPATASIAPGGTVQITAVSRDADGNALPNRSIAFTSTNTGVATVSSSGLVTGVTDGTANIVSASSEGPADTTAVAVSSGGGPPPGNPFANEPAGYTLISDRDFSQLGVCGTLRIDGWDDIEQCPNQGGANITLINDATATISPPSVLQMRYPNGFQGGSSPAVAQRFWALSLGYTRLYHAYAMKLSSNFEGHPSSTNKIHHLWISDPSGNRVFTRVVGQADGPLVFEVALQGVPDARSRLQGNRGVNMEIVRGQWYNIEILLIANTPGQANGVVRAWINGQLAIEYTDVFMVGSGESNVWSQVQFSPTWGGGGGTTTREFYMWIDHTRISAQQ